MRAWQTERKSGQRHAIGAFGVGLAPKRKSPPAGRDFELKPGSIPVAGDCGDRNSMVRAYCREPPALFFAANTESACWYFCWYRQQSTIKTISTSNSYGIKRLSARGTTPFQAFENVDVLDRRSRRAKNRDPPPTIDALSESVRDRRQNAIAYCRNTPWSLASRQRRIRVHLQAAKNLLALGRVHILQWLVGLLLFRHLAR